MKNNKHIYKIFLFVINITLLLGCAGTTEYSINPKSNLRDYHTVCILRPKNTLAFVVKGRATLIGPVFEQHKNKIVEPKIKVAEIIQLELRNMGITAIISDDENTIPENADLLLKYSDYWHVTNKNRTYQLDNLSIKIIDRKIKRNIATATYDCSPGFHNHPDFVEKIREMLGLLFNSKNY